MTTPDQPQPPSGWGEAPEPPRYGQRAPGGAPQYGQGQPRYGQQYGQGQYGQRPAGAPGPYGPYGPAAAKPGIVPLRPLSLGEIYDGAFTAIRHNPKVMLGAATLVLLVATVLGVLVAQLLVPALSSAFGSMAASDPELAELGFDTIYAQVIATSLGTGLTILIAQPVVEGILTTSVSQSVIGRKQTLGQVWERLRGRVGRLIGWALLRTLASLVLVAVWSVVLVVVIATLGDSSVGGTVVVVLLLVVALFAAVVWLGVRVGLVAPALALEGRGLGATIARAWRLTRGSFWRLFGIYLLASIIIGFAANLITYPITLITTAIGGASESSEVMGVSTIVASVLSIIVSTAITTIFTASVVALLYIDVRMRREGLDVQLAAAAQAPEGGTPGGMAGGTAGPRPGPPPGTIA